MTEHSFSQRVKPNFSFSTTSSIHETWLQRIREWFWRSEAIEYVRAQKEPFSTHQQVILQRAKVCADLGDLAFEPTESLPSGAAPAQAISLYREATYWALRTVQKEKPEEKAGLHTLFEHAQSSILHKAAQDEPTLQLVYTTLVERTFVETAELTTNEQEHDARKVQNFVHRLIQQLELYSMTTRQILLQRWSRVGATIFTIIAVVLAGLWFLLRQPNIAANRPWRASSAYSGFPLSGHTDTKLGYNLMFHTNEEDAPWLEIDLGQPKPIHSVEVTNRKDAYSERAIPLVVEVSLDQNNWLEVARRNENFINWNASFPKTNARYVRLKVAKRACFHLEAVAVR